jgi:hypothetical protein
MNWSFETVFRIGTICASLESEYIRVFNVCASLSVSYHKRRDEAESCVYCFVNVCTICDLLCY